MEGAAVLSTATLLSTHFLDLLVLTAINRLAFIQKRGVVVAGFLYTKSPD